LVPRLQPANVEGFLFWVRQPLLWLILLRLPSPSSSSDRTIPQGSFCPALVPDQQQVIGSTSKKHQLSSAFDLVCSKLPQKFTVMRKAEFVKTFNTSSALLEQDRATLGLYLS
jgi:hypothetical protein